MFAVVVIGSILTLLPLAAIYAKILRDNQKQCDDCDCVCQKSD